MLKEIKWYIPNELYNKWFTFFFIISIITITTFKFETSKTLNIILLFLLLSSLILYIKNGKLFDKIDRILVYTILLFFTLFTIGYIASVVNEITITAISLIIATLLMVIIPLILHLSNLWKSKDMKKKRISVIIISYISIGLSRKS